MYRKKIKIIVFCEKIAFVSRLAGERNAIGRCGGTVDVYSVKADRAMLDEIDFIFSLGMSGSYRDGHFNGSR